MRKRRFGTMGFLQQERKYNFCQSNFVGANLFSNNTLIFNDIYKYSFCTMEKGVTDLKFWEKIIYKERDFHTTVGSNIFVVNQLVWARLLEIKRDVFQLLKFHVIMKFSQNFMHSKTIIRYLIVVYYCQRYKLIGGLQLIKFEAILHANKYVFVKFCTIVNSFNTCLF